MITIVYILEEFEESWEACLLLCDAMSFNKTAVLFNMKRDRRLFKS